MKEGPPMKLPIPEAFRLFQLRAKTAMEFPTEEALKKYLKEHPKADRSRHTVKKAPETKSTDESGKDEGATKKKPWKTDTGTYYIGGFFRPEDLGKRETKEDLKASIFDIVQSYYVDLGDGTIESDDPEVIKAWEPVKKALEEPMNAGDDAKENDAILDRLGEAFETFAAKAREAYENSPQFKRWFALTRGDLDDVEWARKAISFGEVPAAPKKLLKRLKETEVPTYTAREIFGPEGAKAIKNDDPLDPDILPEKRREAGPLFILDAGDHGKFLVNTEGFSYARYMLKLPKGAQTGGGGRPTPKKAPSTKKSPPKTYPPPVTEVMNKYELTDDDAEEVREFKGRKPRKPKEKLTDAQLMARFLAEAKPETRERMKGMSPADFMKILGAIMEEDEGDEGTMIGKKSSIDLRASLIRLAHAVPETRRYILPLLKTAEITDGVMAGRRHGEPGKGYGDSPSRGGKGKWAPKPRAKCYYETGDEADRRYVTRNGGPDGQTKPPTSDWKDYEKKRWPK